MTVPQWHFRQFAPGDNLSDPDFTKALFASDSETAVARSLVREAIQNSLDARREDATAVHVRIAIHRGHSAAPAADAAPFTRGLKAHIEASDNGLPERPALSGPIPFLVIEDFGTKGLRGAPEHWKPTGIGNNAFFLFFRALGKSGKENESRGRWGVGKFVFPMSGRAHAIWGLTVPSDTCVPMLMGRAVLRTHEAAGAQWHPDGHWGERASATSNLVTPTSAPELLARFREVFRISRRDEPGLSVVVPWLIDEITVQALRSAVLGEYFLPLLRGELVVRLEENGSVETLDGDAVRTWASRSDDRKLRERLDLAVRIVDGRGVISLEWPATLQWQQLTLNPDDLPTSLRDTLRTALDDGQIISVSIPVTVGRKDSQVAPTGYLKLHMRRADAIGAVRPLLIRDGISLTEDRTKAVYDHVCLAIAEKCALATAIGDAETPAHEQMQHELLKDRYKYPRKLVTFVREAPAALLRAIRHGDSEDDPYSLASFFPVESDDGPLKPAPKPKSKGKDPNGKLPPLPPASPRRFRVARVKGGFSVSGTPEAPSLPEELSVAVAYDVRRGNPFARYRPFDFDLSGSLLQRSAVDCEVVASEGNRVTVRPSARGFSLTITGFDPERDLIVRVRAVGGES